LNTTQLNRRRFLLQSCAALSTTLIWKAGTNTHVAAQTLENFEGKKPDSEGKKPDSEVKKPDEFLKYISVSPTNGLKPAGLIVCLHGYGANAQKLVSLAKSLDLPDYQFLFPDAPLAYRPQAGRKMWYDLNRKDFRGLASSRQLLRDWLKSLKDATGVPLSRTVLSGFSQGAAMALDVGLTLPIAEVVSLSGYLHSNPRPSSKKLLPPVLMIQGKKDEVVTLDEAHSARDTLKAVGVPVNYQEFDMGHEIRKEAVTEMRNFVVNVIESR
jgi:phospholipase/carboxylesterase